MVHAIPKKANQAGISTHTAYFIRVYINDGSRPYSNLRVYFSPVVSVRKRCNM